jgi:hypothetical protein
MSDGNKLSEIKKIDIMCNATARFLNRKIKWTSFSRFWCVLLIMMDF